jgi:hypothetical protein
MEVFYNWEKNSNGGKILQRVMSRSSVKIFSSIEVTHVECVVVF